MPFIEIFITFYSLYLFAPLSLPLSKCTGALGFLALKFYFFLEAPFDFAFVKFTTHGLWFDWEVCFHKWYFGCQFHFRILAFTFQTIFWIHLSVMWLNLNFISAGLCFLISIPANYLLFISHFTPNFSLGLWFFHTILFSVW